MILKRTKVFMTFVIEIKARNLRHDYLNDIYDVSDFKNASRKICMFMLRLEGLIIVATSRLQLQL